MESTVRTQRGVTERANAASAVAVAGDVDDDADRTGDLPCERVVGEACERAERLEPSWDIGEAVGVHRASTTIVTGVQRREQFADFFAATLPHDESVRPHPERFTHEASEADPTGPLKVRLSRFEAYVVRMLETQLGDILDREDAFVTPGLRQKS